MLRDRIERLLKRLAPETSARPLYVYFDDRSWPPGRGYLGFTAPRLDLALQDLPRWEGRGPAIVLNVPAILRDATAFAADLGWDHDAAFEWRATMVAIHELGHILDLAPLYSRACDGPAVPLGDLTRHAAGSATRLLERARPPRFGHEMDTWGRNVLHLASRARLAGLFAPLPVLINHHLYECTHPCKYWEALAGEPARLVTSTFEQIKSTPLPAAFASLWEEDRQC
jgi:hypothetical protein